MNTRLRRIHLEVLALAAQFGTVDFDDVTGTWVLLPNFPLPPGWNRASTRLMIYLPPAYPETPPQHFYLDRGLRDGLGRAPAHYFEGTSGRIGPDSGLACYCLHSQVGSAGGWSPSADLRRGDSLLTYVEVILAVLTEDVRLQR